MFTMSTILTYMVACMVLILIPGPSQALVLSNCISYGKRAGIKTAIGLNTATIFHSVAAALGLSAILATSSLAFSIVKYIGAAYLVYIGIITFLSSGEINLSLQNKSESNLLFKAFLTGALNPKVALFFLAFLPQFIDKKNGYIFLQFVILGLILAILDIIYESFLAVIISTSRKYFENNKRFTEIRQKITGTVLIGLGLRLAFMQKE